MKTCPTCPKKKEPQTDNIYKKETKSTKITSILHSPDITSRRKTKI